MGIFRHSFTHVQRERERKRWNAIQERGICIAFDMRCHLLTAASGHNIERLKGYNE